MNNIRYLLETGTREDLISWLAWNDPNGVYTDSDSLSEGYDPLTYDEARELVQKIYNRDHEGA